MPCSVRTTAKASRLPASRYAPVHSANNTNELTSTTIRGKLSTSHPLTKRASTAVILYPASTQPIVSLSAPNSALRYTGKSGVITMNEKNSRKFATQARV